MDCNSNLMNVNRKDNETMELNKMDVDEELLAETIKREEKLSTDVAQEKPSNKLRIHTTPVRRLSRSRLEKIIEKVTESRMLRSESTDLRLRLDREEMASEALNKRLITVKDRYREIKAAVEKLKEKS